MPESQTRRQVLTQGRNAAQRLLALVGDARATPITGSPSSGATLAETRGAAQPERSAAPLDPQAVAAKVYELWCKEFAAERMRRMP